MDTGGANNLHHAVEWKSSTGDLADLSHINTREHITWDAAPVEFGAAGEYTGAGEHHGLGNNNASGGNAVDDHSVVPTGFRYGLPEGQTQSGTWMMYQQYEYKTDDMSDWAPIEGAKYEITRWYERQGNDLVAYCAKRGTGTDSTMHRAMVHVPGYFA